MKIQPKLFKAMVRNFFTILKLKPYLYKFLRFNIIERSKIDQCLRKFFSHFATMKFLFTYICSAAKTEKITKIHRSFDFSLKFESFKSVRYSL